MQNLPRGGKLRRALIAKPGQTISTIDASQIEARITAWICGQDDLVQQFANGEDVYSSFASEVFGYQVNEKQHPNERFIGKTSVLSLLPSRCAQVQQHHRSAESASARHEDRHAVGRNLLR
jgi:DNA polymerase I-like protein with 3'-5' exonuclease and polymerase domains